MSIETRVLRGNYLSKALDEVAALRILVFRDWPYLYDGDKEYERRYLSVYAENPDAILIGAFDGERLIGAATGTPLEDHADDFAAPFAETSLALEDVFFTVPSLFYYRSTGAEGLAMPFLMPVRIKLVLLGASSWRFVVSYARRRILCVLKQCVPLNRSGAGEGMNPCLTLLRSSPGKILTRNMRPKSRFSSG